MGRGVHAHIEDQLRDAGAVAQIDEDYVAKIAATADPTHENHLLARVLGTQVSTHVRAAKIA
jgi:hypothetical protein